MFGCIFDQQRELIQADACNDQSNSPFTYIITPLPNTTSTYYLIHLNPNTTSNLQHLSRCMKILQWWEKKTRVIITVSVFQDRRLHNDLLSWFLLSVSVETNMISSYLYFFFFFFFNQVSQILLALTDSTKRESSIKKQTWFFHFSLQLCSLCWFRWPDSQVSPGPDLCSSTCLNWSVQEIPFLFSKEPQHKLKVKHMI